MLDPRSEIYPTIEYRPIQPSDLEALEKIHLALFPIRYLLETDATFSSLLLAFTINTSPTYSYRFIRCYNSSLFCSGTRGSSS